MSKSKNNPLYLLDLKNEMALIHNEFVYWRDRIVELGPDSDHVIELIGNRLALLGDRHRELREAHNELDTRREDENRDTMLEQEAVRKQR